MILASLATTLRDLGLPATARTYFLITSALVIILIALETIDTVQRSVQAMQVTGLVLSIVKVVSTASTVMTLLLLPFERLRLVILVCLAIMGLLTLYREVRRRTRAGDRSPSSYIGGLTVIVQFLSMILLTASGLAVVIELIIAPARLLESDMVFTDAIRGWVEILTTMIFLLTLYYIGFYVIRRILGSNSFSWVDPPNWRTLLPHLKYTRKARFGFPPWEESRLGDTVRMAYIRHIVGSAELEEVVAAAHIQPVRHPERGFTFAVIGDPGEGDHSQIAPSIGQEEVQEAMEAADQPAANPGFIVISSDVVYPAGELMDYERTVYRPYRVAPGQPSPLIYGLPGNHDWYNNLKGLFLNFGYAAAHVDSDDPQLQAWAEGLRTGPWARYGLAWGKLRWNEVANLRERYGLQRLGGELARPETHQRLPFFELDFGAVPFVLLAADTGCVGGLDAIQAACLCRPQDHRGRPQRAAVCEWRVRRQRSGPFDLRAAAALRDPRGDGRRYPRVPALSGQAHHPQGQLALGPPLRQRRRRRVSVGAGRSELAHPDGHDAA